jgi:glycosyltransferase involved in cell wall biosynthesis
VRIARILTRLNLGGPARQVLASDPLLQERGHTLRVFAGTPEPGEGDLFETLANLGVDVVRVPGLGRGLSLTGDLRAGRFLRRELKKFAPDVVHTHASKAGTLGRRAARRLTSVAVVHTFHGHVLEGYFPTPVAKTLAAHERRLAKSTRRVVAVSHSTADDLVRLGVATEQQIVVSRPGIMLDEFLQIEGREGSLRALCGVGEDVVLVGVLGRLAEVKQPGVALDVFELLAERHPNMQLVFVGDGSERRGLERRILASETLRERVHLVGAQTDMPAVLADLDIVLLTSRTEGMPVALIEAGAAARPVVATPVGGVGELIAHERTGFLGEGADDLAFALDPLVRDPLLRDAVGRRARVRMRERHDAKGLADRLEALYEAVAAEVQCAS